MNCARTGRALGFTMVELMVGIALVTLLSMLALPAYSTFMRNSEIRTVAESVQNALQLARTEAVRRNENIQVQLPNTLDGAAVAGGTDWAVMAAASATPTVFDQVVQRRIEPKPTTLARVGVADVVSAAVAGAGAGMPATLTFTSAGRLSVATTVRQIDITGAAGARRLTLVLTPAGGVRMCDPAVSLATNPQGCS
jgi:type IV fimbrial biogenesis protein FimT